MALAVLIETASPAPTATPAVLKEIGRTGPAGVCGALVVHANSAIAAALRDDALVARAIARLRSVDLENGSSARTNAMKELGSLGTVLREESGRGEAELKRLRDLSEKGKDERQKSEARVFADALGRALVQHQHVAADLNNFVAYLDYHDLRENPLNDASRRGSSLDPFGTNPYVRPTPSAPPGTLYGAAGSPNKMAMAAAYDFEGRMPDVRAHEGRAADHSEAAVSGCSS